MLCAFLVLGLTAGSPGTSTEDRTSAGRALAGQASSVSSASSASSGLVQMFVEGVIPSEQGPAVLLRDAQSEHVLPINIGLSEAHAIQLRLERRRFPRPLTHDLLDAIMKEMGGTLIKIHVDDVHKQTFVGTVFVRMNGGIRHFDARPSDSIALALGARVPIYVARRVLDKATPASLNAPSGHAPAPPSIKPEEEKPKAFEANPNARTLTIGYAPKRRTQLQR